MKLSRKGVAIGLVVGALAGGAGAALATSGDTTTTTPHYGLGPGPGHMQGAGRVIDHDSVRAAVATYLGLSETELQTQHQDKSLADIAKAQGKSVSGLKDAIVAAITSSLDANSDLTADEKAAILAQVETHVDTMVDKTCSHEMGAGFGRHGWRGGADS